MMWIDPDIEPEFLRMIHPGNMLTLSEPDRFWDIFANTGVSFEMELCPVKTLIFKPPFLGCSIVVGKDRAEDVGQLPVIVLSEVSQFNWECPLSRHEQIDHSRNWLNLCKTDISFLYGQAPFERVTSRLDSTTPECYKDFPQVRRHRIQSPWSRIHAYSRDFTSRHQTLQTGPGENVEGG